MFGSRNGSSRVLGVGHPLQERAGVSDVVGGLGWSQDAVGMHGAFVQNAGLRRAEFGGDHGELGVQGQVERGSQRRGSVGGHGGAVGEVGADVQVGSAVRGRGSFTSSGVVQGGRHEPVLVEDYENVEIGLSLNTQSFFQ
jgi:hypothetical protein